jgi:predicted porin
VQPGVPSHASIFNNHIFRSKLNYQFTRALSLRAIVDYNAVLPNSELVNLERTKRLTGDVLVTYLLNPGTALYVGYTDRFENLAIDQMGQPSLRRTVSPTTGVGRQFFVKMSYLFRF